MIIDLSKVEALVLHDLLHRISGESSYYEDIAEQYGAVDKAANI